MFKNLTNHRLTRRQIDYYLHRIYGVLRTGRINVVLERMRKNRGLTDGETIWLDPEDRILPTIIHECLHVLYPFNKGQSDETQEKLTLKLEKRIARRMTVRQMKKLFLLLAEQLQKSKQSPSLKRKTTPD